LKSLWCDDDAAPTINDPLLTRVYSSRLLGRDSSLVLHGGGNTSVKSSVVNIFGEEEDILYVKGSGWDLATIEAPGFSPVRLSTLKRLATLDELSDAQMVSEQRAAMLDPSAPTPSVEAILHALIPYKFVDHTHADAVVTLTNIKDGELIIRNLYGERVLLIPYVMPGFVLAKKIHQLTEDINWDNIDGLVLLHHGVFSFANDAKTSYENMIDMVTIAETYITNNIAINIEHPSNKPYPRGTLLPPSPALNTLALASLRQTVSNISGKTMLASLDCGTASLEFVNKDNVADIACRGPLTPDHVIRTKRIPAVITNNVKQAMQNYSDAYNQYFSRFSLSHHQCLDMAPRWAIWPGMGIISFGTSISDVNIIQDIAKHTIKSIQNAELLGGWQALPAKDIFDIEYWELEQAKLKKSGKSSVFQGQVALVTGAASGIGKACVNELQALGAAVIALDISKTVMTLFDQNKSKRTDILPIVCDVTSDKDINSAIELGVATFGGLDFVVSNAGTFPSSRTIARMTHELWDNSIATNLTSHQKILSATIPYLELGINPAILIVGSKNVPAPGPGASAYSVAKAGLTQLARVAALELAEKKIRINIVHPNAVFDTAIWTDEILEKRATHYGLSVQEYKSNNLLKTEVTSPDVAELICTMLGPSFSKTTGAQVAIDGGNERVI